MNEVPELRMLALAIAIVHVRLKLFATTYRGKQIRKSPRSLTGNSKQHDLKESKEKSRELV
jgi:hypothetical protein